MKRILSGLFVHSYLFFLPLVSFAQNQSGGNYNQSGNTSSGSSGQLVNPLNDSSICGLLKDVLNIVMQIAIPFMVLFLVLAGFNLVAARGSAEKLTQAKKNFLFTLIGIALFLGAWTLALVLAGTVNSLGNSLGQPNSVGTC